LASPSGEPRTGESSESENLIDPDHYDTFAESYSAENESSLLNAYYERPR
jgi:hypothetical protein